MSRMIVHEATGTPGTPQQQRAVVRARSAANRRWEAMQALVDGVVDDDAGARDAALARVDAADADYADACALLGYATLREATDALWEAFDRDHVS